MRIFLSLHHSTKLHQSFQVLLDVGLCISFYDFIRVDDGYIYPAEGCAHQRAEFHLVVFRPFVGEVISGRVTSCSREGVKVSLGFFNDIIIPSYLLQSPSEFDPVKSVWVWRYEEADAEFVLGANEEVRVIRYD